MPGLIANNIESLGGSIKPIKNIVAKVNSISDLLNIDTSKLDDKEQFHVLGFHEPNDDGGGIFYWDVNEDKSNHNGGTIISPDAIFPSDWSDTNQQETWFTSGGTGNGCWKRVVGDYITPEMFGAKGDGVTDDTKAMQKAVDFCKYRLFTPAGSYRVGNIYIKKPIHIYGSELFKAEFLPVSGATGYLFNIEPGNDLNFANAVYGVVLENLYLNGDLRQYDCGGIKVKWMDRSYWRNIQIRHFKREGIKFEERVRECDFYSVYVRHCGDKINGYPAVNLCDYGSQDAHNNLNFYGGGIIYPHGNAVDYDCSNSTNVRNIKWIGTYFHGLVEDADTYSPYSAEEASCVLHSIKSAEGIYFIACTATVSGLGRPMLETRTGSNGILPEVFICGGHWHSHYKQNQSFTVTVDPNTDIISHSHNYPPGTGSIVRISSDGDIPGGLSPNTDYFVIFVSDTEFKLATSLQDAETGNAIDITDSGSGTITITIQDIGVYAYNGNVHIDNVDWYNHLSAITRAINGSIYWGVNNNINNCGIPENTSELPIYSSINMHNKTINGLLYLKGNSGLYYQSNIDDGAAHVFQVKDGGGTLFDILTLRAGPTAYAQISRPFGLRSYSDSTRPDASNYPAGTMIWNTDDNAPNFSDGTNWRDATGALT